MRSTSTRPDWLALALWAVDGIVAALALAGAMTIGVLVLPAAVILTAVLAANDRTRQGWPGVLAGGALLVAFIGWLNRGGPGHVCESIPGGFHCVDKWSPVPFALVALGLVAVGVALERRTRRSGR